MALVIALACAHGGRRLEKRAASQDARALRARHIASQTECLRLLTSSAAVSSNLSHDCLMALVIALVMAH